MRTRRSRARRGMTLMELVIALAITGLMAAAGAAAFGSIIDHKRIIREASVSTERAGALREMIESWVTAGQINITVGGLPSGLSRGVGAGGGGGRGSQGGSSIASVTAAQGIGDDLKFTTQALNPSMTGNVQMRLYIDGDANTPETGLTIEYQPNLTQPLVRKMLDSTIDSLRIEYRDQRTGRWFAASQAATLGLPTAARVTLISNRPALQSRIIGIPMIFTSSFTVTNSNRTQ